MFSFPEKYRNSQFPQTTKWFEKIMNSPEALKAYGRTLLCKTPLKAFTGEVKKNPRIKIPIIGNGDVTTPERAKECFDKRMAECEAHKAECEAKKAEIEKVMANWDNMTIEEQKAFFDENAPCCKGHKCCKEAKEGCCKKEGEGCCKDGQKPCEKK